MPLELAYHVITKGPPQWVHDHAHLLIRTTATLAVLVLVKLWTSGATNRAERDMHGRVVMVTGGTSGIGSHAVFDLANRGAQVLLLTQAPVSDPFLADHIIDLRERTRNNLIYAEQVDLSSLHSVRRFATKWIDNAPPRRLDMIVLNAATTGSTRATTAATATAPPTTDEGVDETWMVNYLANFHLLAMLSPALRAQPVDRDVRVVVTTCASYIGSPPLFPESTLTDNNSNTSPWSPTRAYARSKLALVSFALAYQKHLDSYKRPDGLPMNARVVLVDPGFCRTPGTRRWLTRGSLWGLLLYLITYPVPWLLLKSPAQGAQSLLHAVMDPELGRGPGGRFVKECREVDFARRDLHDETIAKKLWEESDELVTKVEKEQAMRRAKDKKREGDETKAADEDERSREMEDLVGSIKKGKRGKKTQAAGKEKKEKSNQKENGDGKGNWNGKGGKKKAKKADS